MNKNNDTMGVKLRNIDVGKADASVVLTPQGDKDGILLARLLGEEISVEAVTLSDTLEEIEGHMEKLPRGYVRGVRLAVRPGKVEKKPEQKDEPKKATPKATRKSD